MAYLESDWGRINNTESEDYRLYYLANVWFILSIGFDQLSHATITNAILRHYGMHGLAVF